MPLVMPGGASRLSLPERLRVAVEIVETYCAARWWILRLTFPDAVAAARRADPAHAESYTSITMFRLGAAVSRTLRALPVDARCLVTSLVLTRMLARRGIETTLVLGVRNTPSFAAHAWIEHNGVALLPTTPDFERLAEL